MKTVKDKNFKFSDWMIQSKSFKSFANSPLELSLELSKEELMALKNSHLIWKASPIWSENNGFFLQFGADQLLSLNPQLLRFYVNQEPLLFNENTIIERTQELDLQEGSYKEHITLRASEGYVSLTITKYLDLIFPYCFGFEVDISASFSSELKIESLVTIDQAVPEKVEISDRLLSWTVSERNEDKKQEIAIAAKSFLKGELMTQVRTEEHHLLEVGEAHFESNSPLHFDKVMAIATNQELEDAPTFVRQSVESLPLAEIKDRSREYWQGVWQSSDMKLSGLPFSLTEESSSKDGIQSYLQSFLRLSVFKLNQVIEKESSLPEETSDLIDYALWNHPKIAEEGLKRQINALLQRKDNLEQLETFPVLYQIWIYEHLLGSQSLLNNGGLELLLTEVKQTLSQLTKDEAANYHFEAEKSFYKSLTFFWLLQWLQALPKKRNLDLRLAAEKTTFGTKDFEKAREVSNHFEIDLENLEAKDFLTTVDIFGFERVKALLAQIGRPIPETFFERQISKIENEFSSSEANQISKLTLANLYASIGQLERAEEILTEEILHFEENINENKNSLKLETAVLRLLRHKIAGISISKGSLAISPKLPQSWERLLLHQKYRGAEIEIEISQQLLLLKSDRDVSLNVYGKTIQLTAEKLSSFAIRR